MIFCLAQVPNPATQLIAWVRVSQTGGLNPASQQTFKVAQVATWRVVDAGSWPAARAAAEKEEGRVMTQAEVASLPPRRPFGGRVAAVPVDDSKVPVIQKTLVKDGWGLHRIYIAGLGHDVFTDPEGREYARAKDSEPADLIVDLTWKYPTAPPMRLRLLEGSRLEKKAKKEERLVAKGERLRNARFQQDLGDPTALPADALARTKIVRRKK